MTQNYCRELNPASDSPLIRPVQAGFTYRLDALLTFTEGDYGREEQCIWIHGHEGKHRDGSGREW